MHSAVCAQVVLSALCEAEGCPRTALYNFEGEHRALACREHSAEGMASPALATPCSKYQRSASDTP